MQGKQNSVNLQNSRNTEHEKCEIENMLETPVIHMVSAHAEGEVGKVITDGVPPPPGDTLWEQRDWLASDGGLRDLLLHEPRGGVFTHVNLLVPPIDSRASAGFLIMEPVHTPPMSGSNAICVATVCLEHGLVPMSEPFTEFFLEAPAGIVPVRASCADGSVRSVEISNVPSFADRLGAPLEMTGHPTVSVDTAYGGDSFVLVNAADLGFTLSPDEGRDIADAGAKLTAAANEQLGFSHPEQSWSNISFCQFTSPLRRNGSVLEGVNAVVIDPGRIDRSPCGTGCSARMAVMHARGELSEGDGYIGRSIIGGRFECRITGITSVGGRTAVQSSICGRAWITGTHQVMCDPTDPWPRGYRVADTWPPV